MPANKDRHCYLFNGAAFEVGLWARFYVTSLYSSWAHNSNNFSISTSRNLTPP